MLHELSTFDDAVFITLTYMDSKLPPYNSLRKADFQKFMKRLRKSIEPKKIRYFACGEYGDTTQRPHYHAIIFGLSMRPEDKKLIMDAWPFADWSVPAIRKNSFGLVENESIRYVAQYVDKKYSGDLAKQEYELKKREPVFKLSSLGIGSAYIKKHGDQLKSLGYCTVQGVLHSLPRYYLNKLGVDPQLYRNEIYFKECEDYEDATGLNLHPDIAYRVRPSAEVTQYNKAMEDKRKQSELNKKAKLSLKKRKL